jgi:hypothetical protein
MACSIPISLAFQNVAIRMMHSMDIANVIPRETNGKLVASGGILMLDLLELPEPPKVANNWTMTPITGNGNLNKLPYPKKKEGDDQVSQEDLTNSFQVTLTIPNYTENCKVKFWNDCLNEWDDNGIRDQQFDSVTKKLCFWTSRFATYGLVRVSILIKF